MTAPPNETSAIELAIHGAKHLRPIPDRPPSKQRLQAAAKWGLVVALVVLYVAFCTGVLQLGLVSAMLAIAGILIALLSIILLLLADVGLMLAPRAAIAAEAGATQDAIEALSAQLWQRCPCMETWERAAETLEYKSREVQQWRVFAIGTLALGLTLYLSTKSADCLFGTPLDVLTALADDPRTHFSGLRDPCGQRGWIGAALFGMLIAVIPLQWKVSTLLRAAALAQRVKRHGGKRAWSG